MDANMENDMSKAINECDNRGENASYWYVLQTIIYPILIIIFLLREEDEKENGVIVFSFVILGILMARSAYRIVKYIKHEMSIFMIGVDITFSDMYKNNFNNAILAYRALVWVCCVDALLALIKVFNSDFLAFVPLLILTGISKFVLDAYGTSKLFATHSYADDGVSQYDTRWKVTITTFIIILSILFFASLWNSFDFYYYGSYYIDLYITDNIVLILGIGVFLYGIYLGYRMDYANRLQQLINRIEKNDGSGQEPM